MVREIALLAELTTKPAILLAAAESRQRLVGLLRLRDDLGQHRRDLLENGADIHRRELALLAPAGLTALPEAALLAEAPCPKPPPEPPCPNAPCPKAPWPSPPCPYPPCPPPCWVCESACASVCNTCGFCRRFWMAFDCEFSECIITIFPLFSVPVSAGALWVRPNRV